VNSDTKNDHKETETDEVLAQRELEAKSLAKANAQSLSRLASADVDELSTWNKWVAKDLAQHDWIVQDQSLSNYALPSGFKAFLGKELVAQWNSISCEVAEIHAEVVGMRVGMAGVVLAGDERLDLINAELRTWANQCVSKRIEKTSYRQGGPMRQYQDLYTELIPTLEKIAFREGTANRFFYGEFCDYLPTQIYLNSAKIFVECRFDKKRLLPTYRIVDRTPESATHFAQLVDIYQWQHLDDLTHVMETISSSTDLDQTTRADLNNDQIRERLQRLVDDIQEMRPFLRHNYKAENTIIEIAPEVFLSFHWAVARGVGFMPIAPSKAELLSHLRDMTSGLSLSIGYDGLLTNFTQQWINTNSLLSKQPNALRINLFIVEAVHAKLFALYEKVDIAAIVARYKTRAIANSNQNQTIEPTDEEFAAVCQALAEPDDQATYSNNTHRLKSIRVKRLLVLLQDHLGCEVRQGKGSEIVVYREGGHHFRLGHHKRNPYVSVVLIKNLLRRIGISFDKWMHTLS
jgi:hypothetical protein